MYNKGCHKHISIMASCEINRYHVQWVLISTNTGRAHVVQIIGQWRSGRENAYSFLESIPICLTTYICVSKGKSISPAQCNKAWVFGQGPERLWTCISRVPQIFINWMLAKRSPGLFIWGSTANAPNDLSDPPPSWTRLHHMKMK